MSFRAIIFDFFGVLCSEIAPFWLGEHFAPEEARRVKATIIAAADRGKLSQAELFASLGSMVGVPPFQVENDWYSLAHLNPDMVPLLRAAHSVAKTGLLTNSPSPFVRRLIGEYSLGALFTEIVVSSEVGIAKPDAGIFQEMLRRLSTPPSETVIIDDNSENVSAARSLGIIGVVFKSPDDVAALLNLHGT